ncbi:CCA tRNA nucleotidyltransferase [Falsihalocynthiibacter sp. SS001]|uniref:CCA tRNA nucleotidyltransferase n=1 Tax=Falsihalocynthiibacter sp. SS001 TaxID=3349698 RepID=UPI0036D28D5C
MRADGDWVTEAGAQAVFSMLKGAGHKALFVGGCVRNALLGAPINDIDIATDATPTKVLELAKTASIRAVATGLAHGTITLVVDGKPFEVTTFRKDVETDGRRAVVSFSKEISEDARRRDFTINALYAEADGTVVDPLGGLQDITARRVRFIEDADRRIKEDYLRILRFFRFYAWYGDPNGGIDAEGLTACAANLDGIETLAKERIGAEMLKLLAAYDPAPAVSAMAQSGVLGALIAGSDAKYLPVLVHLEQEIGVASSALRRLAVLGGEDVEQALRLSKADTKALTILRDEIGSARGAAELGYRYGAELAVDILLLRGALFETNVQQEALVRARHAADQVFPVKAADLMPNITGPALGKTLAKLEADWVSSDFILDKQALLRRVLGNS